MKKFRSITMSLIIICGLVLPSIAYSETKDISNSDKALSVEVDVNAIPFDISQADVGQLPRPIQDYIESNPDAKMISTVFYHYRLEKNSEGEIRKNLVRSFEVVDEKSLREFSNYSSSIQPLTTNVSSKPVLGQDLLIGITTYSYSSTTHPTFYQVQGWWEWKQSSVGVFSAAYDVVGLTFFGETYGYDYYPLANNIWNNSSVTLNLHSSNDNGAGYVHPSGSALTYGALLGKLYSSNGNDQESFQVAFTYEHFEGNPDPIYLTQLVQWIIGLFVPENFPLLPQNARFEISTTLHYGNAQ